MLSFLKRLLGCREEELLKECIELREEIFKLEKEKEELDYQSLLEEELNDKYPKTSYFYKGGRLTPKYNKEIGIDVRNFFNPYDENIKMLLKEIKAETDDDKAFECLKWVMDNIKYKSDISARGRKEYWQYAYETAKIKEGDCEDGMILLMNLMLQAGIPYWKIRPSMGFVKVGNKKVGHAYLTYYYEEEDKWVLLDWCYYNNRLPISLRLDYKDEELYIHPIWASWNLKYIFSDKY